MIEFMNLNQGSMSMREYALKFNKLYKYAPHLFADPRARISKFLSSVSDLVNEECHTSMLVSDIDLSQLMTYFEQLEGEKLRKRRSGESTRAQLDGSFQGFKGGRFH